LHALYAVPANEGRGIYYTRSSSGGDIWSLSRLVFDAAAAGWAAVDGPRLAVELGQDGRSTLHAVWVRAALSPDQPPLGVYYARSEDGGQTWSEAQRVAEGAYAWPQVAVSGPGQVHLLWGAASGSHTWWHRRTLGAGEQALAAGNGWAGWTRPEQVPGFGDVPGPVGLAADAAGGLHLAGLGQDLYGEPALLYMVWEEGRWSEREAHRLEARDTAPGLAAAAGAASPRIDVALRLAARDSASAVLNVWHSDRALEIAGRSNTAGPLPTPAADTPIPIGATPTSAVPTPTVQATPDQARVVPNALPPQTEEGPGAALPLLVGGGLAMLVVAGIFAVRGLRGTPK
jgi:hypothetical protein